MNSWNRLNSVKKLSPLLKYFISFIDETASYLCIYLLGWLMFTFIEVKMKKELKSKILDDRFLFSCILIHAEWKFRDVCYTFQNLILYCVFLYIILLSSYGKSVMQLKIHSFCGFGNVHEHCSVSHKAVKDKDSVAEKAQLSHHDCNARIFKGLKINLNYSRLHYNRAFTAS